MNRTRLKAVGQSLDTSYKETALVVNPGSRGGLTGKRWDSTFSEITTVLGERLEVAFAKKSSDGTCICRDLLRNGYKQIIAIGGDGTINAVANGFFEDPIGINKSSKASYSNYPRPSELRPINPEAVLGIIPSGTRNVFSKTLGLPEGIIECCRIFARGKPRKIDLISATVTDRRRHAHKSRIIVNAAEIGAGAELIGRSKKVRKLVNSRLVSTVTGIVTTVPSYQSNKCQFVLNGGRTRFNAMMTMTVVANGKFLGGGFRAAPRANISDRLLDLVVVKNSGSLKIIDELIRIKHGDYVDEDNVYYNQVSKVAMASLERSVSIAIDGEPVGILPATFEVVPNALALKI